MKNISFVNAKIPFVNEREALFKAKMFKQTEIAFFKKSKKKN